MKANYMRIVEQTDEEKFKMYMKQPKRKLAEMLIQCNKVALNIKPPTVKAYIPYQICPKCNGVGEHFPDNFGASTAMYMVPCQVCKGAKIIPMYVKDIGTIPDGTLIITKSTLDVYNKDKQDQ